jgi:hypothetical protein
MTSPMRCNCRHAVHDNQDRPLPPVPQPDLIPQAGPIPQPLAWQPPLAFHISHYQLHNILDCHEMQLHMCYMLIILLLIIMHA